MTSVHTTFLFSTMADASTLQKQAAVLMDRLLELESEDPRVTDSTVSLDAGLGVVEVETFSTAGTRDEAEDLSVSRIQRAVSETVGLSNTVERERRVELVDA